jgi:transposase
MNSKDDKTVRRRAKRIPETAQMQLSDSGPTVSKSDREAAFDEDFINPSPEKIFIGDRRLREYLCDCGMDWAIRLRELLEESDLSEIKAGYQATGRKAIHPVVMLGLIVYGIIEGKSSLRELELLSSKDVGAWWVCGGLRPDHSTIGKFIVRFGDILTQKYFIDLTRMLLKKLRISAGDVAGDGTVIEAAANRYKTIKAEAARQAAADARKRAKVSPHDKELIEQAADARALAELADKREAGIIKHRRRDPKKLKLSATDPDAVFQTMKNKTTRPSYKPSILANAAQMIVGKHVDPSDETAAVLPMLEQHRTVFGALPKRAMFDAGYHNMTVLSMSVELEMDVLCPSSKADGGQWERKLRAGKFDKSAFNYDHDRDVYVCPAGAELKRGRSRKKGGMNTVTYRGGAARCNDCDLRSKCTSDKKGRTIDRYEVDELKEAMAKVFENERARKTYSRRKAIVEPVFGRIRERQGLNRFSRRGLKKVAVEFSLHCIAYNLRRAIRLETVGLFCAILAEAEGEIRIMGVVFWVFNTSGKYP